MGTVNKAIVVGHIGKAGELRHTPGGQPVCDFRLATNDRYTARDGQSREKTEWHTIVLWGKRATALAAYLAKGRAVYVEGRLQTREYDRDGQKHWKTEIVADQVQFLGPRVDRSDGRGASMAAEPPPGEPGDLDDPGEP